MTDSTLLTLFDETRRKTLWLTDVEPAAARWTPPGTKNSITWHAGHILCIVEQLTQGALRQTSEIPPEIPAGWWDLFGWDSSPGPSDQLPHLIDVRRELEKQYQRLRPILADISEEKLSANLQLPEWGEIYTVRRWIIHALHDESGHGGEIWLLRKLYKHQA